MNTNRMTSAALAIFILAGTAAAEADSGTDRYQFNFPSFSFGFEVPKGGGSNLAPLDDDFDDKRAQREFAPEPEPYANGKKPEYDGYGDDERRSLKDGDQERDERDRADRELREPPDEFRPGSWRRFASCLPTATISRNLRLAGWHNFRDYNYDRHLVKVTADNPVGIPFRLTIGRCMGALLFARIL